MKGLRGQRLLLAISAPAVFVASIVAVWFLLANPAVPSGPAGDAELDHQPRNADVRPVVESISLEERLLRDLNHADSEAAKLARLDEFSRDPEARSTAPALRTAMVVDRNSAVRLKAFEVAKDLAVKEDRSALISVLRDGVGNPNADVRRAGIRACRDHPQYDLMKDLLEVVERGGPERPLAIQALAFLDDPEAQQTVLDTARSEELPREQRVQAIVLLCRTRLDEGVRYLQELATGDDEELRKYAMEALSIWQKNKSNG